MDPALHSRYCGTSNETILENFVALLERSRSVGFEILPGTPLIPGVTDTETNLHAIADFLRGHGVKQAALLPNNPLWLEKGIHLGQPQTDTLERRLGSFYEPERLEECKALFSDYGICCDGF
ncbi:MAG: hypothetical protein GY723_16745 [bacterium]|nr:hypothetical protein [bacterium]